jgi:putative flippase GtrA
VKQFGAFMIAGGIAAAANIGSRILFSLVMPYELAIVFGYAVGVTIAFGLNRRYVFRDATGSTHGQYGRFVLVNVVAFAQVWLVSVGLARFLFPAIGFSWHSETIAHVVGVLSPVATSYLLHKHFSFAKQRLEA